MMNRSVETKRILVVGSSNTDMVIKTEHLPAPGETVLGGTFFMNPGGKGANQAVAVARLGGNVRFVCKLGDDIFGRQAKQLFAAEGIDTSYVFTDSDVPSGVALITVDDQAENCIAVASGANANLSPADLQIAETAIDQSEWILMQLEIPIETVFYMAETAWRKGKKIVLNPAPAQTLPFDLYPYLYLITPNKTEAEMLTGIQIVDEASAIAAALVFANWGVQHVIITLGSKGALIYSEGKAALIPAIPVKAMDTTAAGDIFNGALVVALSDGMDLWKATGFASKVAALSVMRVGAQSSAPYRNEVELWEVETVFHFIEIIKD